MVRGVPALSCPGEWADNEIVIRGRDMPGIADKIQHFRQRATQARVDAEKMTVPQAKQLLLETAADFERLASRLEVSANRPRDQISD